MTTALDPVDEILAPNSFFQTMVTWKFIESTIVSVCNCAKKYKNVLPEKRDDPRSVATQELHEINSLIDQWKKDNNIKG